jgi:hypothetical protein
MTNLSQVSRCPGQDSSREPPEYKTDLLGWQLLIAINSMDKHTAHRYVCSNRKMFQTKVIALHGNETYSITHHNGSQSRWRAPKRAWNAESEERKNYRNAPKLSYQQTKFSVYLLTLWNPEKSVQLA